jgi:hypothetical protein
MLCDKGPHLIGNSLVNSLMADKTDREAWTEFSEAGGKLGWIKPIS